MPGIGQMYNGQVAKGLTFMVTTWILGCATGGYGLTVLIPFLAIDAYLIADKHRKQKYIGPWECL